MYTTFSSHFEFHIIPEWSEHYLEYKQLNEFYKKLSKLHKITRNNTK